MKYKKTILGILLFIISIAFIIHPYLIQRGNYLDAFKEQIIRFHIKANSDRKEDQALKLKIRDEILKEAGELFASSKSIDETRAIVVNNMEYIKSIAQRIIKEEGKDLPVNIYLGIKNFPTRKYGNIVFPSGEYETLQVTIGEGKGENWWCVMFPPLCFVDIDHGNAKNTKKDLKKVLTEEEINLLLAQKEPPIVLKSKVAEVLGKKKNHFVKYTFK